MKLISPEGLKNYAKIVVSGIITAIIGGLIAILVAGFSGLFAPFWAGPPGSHIEDPFGYAISGLKMAIAGSVRNGWIFGALVFPLVSLKPICRMWFVKTGIWTLAGVIYGFYAFGGYVRHGDASGLIMAPYGLYCGLIAEPVHKWMWIGLAALKRGIKRLHEQEIG